MKNSGLIHVYTGNGKGKSTAAFGLGLRAFGAGKTVYTIQFLKTAYSSELSVIKQFEPKWKVFRFETEKGFFWNLSDNEKETLKKEVEEAFDFAENVMKTKECDLLILDEIMGTLANKLLDVKQVVKALNNKHPDIEVVMTGRNVPEDISEIADYVTEMKCLKHPYEQGIPAREGIEF